MTKSSSLHTVTQTQENELADVIHMYDSTSLEQDSREVLLGLAERKPAAVFVVAWDENGEATYHSTTSDFPVVLNQLRMFEHKYYNGDFTGRRV